MLQDWNAQLVDAAPSVEVAKYIATAIDLLLREDAYLLEVDANERSISHRLAIHLAGFFPEWHVDCEYNRDGHEPKRLQLNPAEILSDDDKGSTVYPDVIIHCRGTERNLLAIEIKKVGGGSEADDLHKLRRMRAKLHYELGLFVRFSVGPGNAGVEHIRWSVD